MPSRKLSASIPSNGCGTGRGGRFSIPNSTLSTFLSGSAVKKRRCDGEGAPLRLPCRTDTLSWGPRVAGRGNRVMLVRGFGNRLDTPLAFVLYSARQKVGPITTVQSASRCRGYNQVGGVEIVRGGTA